MAITLAMTTISVARVDTTPGDDDVYDPYDPDTNPPTTIAAGVRATIGTPTATVDLVGGTQVAYSATIACDPCDLEPEDTVTDTAGTVWTVMWARLVQGFGLDHIEGELRLVTGQSSTA